MYCVRFNRVSKEVSCDCCKFETFGIFCKHCIRVLDQNLVFDIPEKYILDRWRKDVVRKHTRVKVAYHDPSDTMEVQRFNRIMTKFKPICDEASMVDDDTVDMVLSTLSKLRIDVSDRRKKFIEANGVLTLPSTQYPTSGKGSTSNAITPSSERKQIPTHTPEGVDLVDPDDDVPDQVVSQPKAVPQISQQLLDPNTNKRPRGRPKGSRNKPLSETGYKTINKKQGKDVQPTDADMDMDLPMRDVLPSLAAPKLVPAKVVKLSLLFQSIKCCYNLKLELMLYSVNFGTL